MDENSLKKINKLTIKLFKWCRIKKYLIYKRTIRINYIIKIRIYFITTRIIKRTLNTNIKRTWNTDIKIIIRRINYVRVT